MIAKDDSNWFVAQLRPQGLRRAQEHLQRQGFETFSPEILTTAKNSLTSRKPLFPGYVFVKFDPETPNWGAINSTRGVARLILNDPRQPVPLPKQLMAGLMARCDADSLISPDPDLMIGDRIRVLAGSFADLVTTIETLPSPERIGVLIDLMGRKVRTSLGSGLIARI